MDQNPIHAACSMVHCSGIWQALQGMNVSINKTNRQRSNDDDRARHQTAVKADSISSSVMGPLWFPFQTVKRFPSPAWRVSWTSWPHVKSHELAGIQSNVGAPVSGPATHLFHQNFLSFNMLSWCRGFEALNWHWTGTQRQQVRNRRQVAGSFHPEPGNHGTRKWTRRVRGAEVLVYVLR